MKFVTHNDKDISADETCLQGYVKVSYADLVKKFGEPIDGDGYKVDAEWVIKFKNGEVATIYNYKDGKNYNGESGTSKEDITVWHVGGHKFIVGGNKEIVSLVEEVLKEKTILKKTILKSAIESA